MADELKEAILSQEQTDFVCKAYNRRRIPGQINPKLDVLGDRIQTGEIQLNEPVFDV